MESTNPPPELQSAGALLWKEMQAEFEFRAHERAILRQLCIVEDRLSVLNQKVAEEGPIISSAFSGDSRANPAAVEGRQLMITQSRLLAALRLPDSDGLTPQRRQVRGVYLTKRLRGVG